MIRPSTQKTGSSAATSELPPAVLVGFDSMQGLPAARVLARHGVPVIGIAAHPNNSQAKTNVCREIRFTSTDEPSLIDHLVELGQTLPVKSVLFPCADTNVLLISQHRNRLEPFFHILLPDSNTVEMLMDKVSFYSYAERNSLPVPKTFYIESDEQLEIAARELTYPCIFKPRDSAAHLWEDKTIHKAFKVEDAASLKSLYQDYKSYSDCFIAQQWIEGKDSDLYSFNGYFDRKSKPLATFIARKIRQWPPETGVSCLGEEVRNDTVLETAIQMFQTVNYHGLGYLEMKYDQTTKQLLIVEPNIGRPTGRGTIAEAGGVDILFTAYCDALGLSLPKNRTQSYSGVKWIHLRKDIQSSFVYWRRGELQLVDWIKSIRGKKAYAVASWRDPLPFIFDCWQAVSLITSSRRRKKRQVAPTTDD
ncbi:carboxylate--amine ligase [bacterium]|nr:hypothetical protein [Mariniblastus sp.]MDA7928731.1 hypothetical protein [Mariniblastus sp.]MDB4374495.1 carboxylate--amine ligase [bacterium]MDC3224083.1 hypothetical protein [Mariniblastus sp.]